MIKESGSFVIVGQVEEKDPEFVGIDYTSGGYIFFTERLANAKMFFSLLSAKECCDFWKGQSNTYLKGHKLRICRLQYNLVEIEE